MMVGALHEGTSVGTVEAEHSEELASLVAELCAAGEVELGVKLEPGAIARLAAYGRSVAHFPTAVKEFGWRNGWFHAISQAAHHSPGPGPRPSHRPNGPMPSVSQAALAAGRPDPMPQHTAGLKTLGVIN